MLLTKNLKKSTLLIGIDGCGGSGKSTFAYKLKEELSNSTIVHKDDFYLSSSNILNTHPSKNLSVLILIGNVF